MSSNIKDQNRITTHPDSRRRARKSEGRHQQIGNLKRKKQEHRSMSLLFI